MDGLADRGPGTWRAQCAAQGGNAKIALQQDGLDLKRADAVSGISVALLGLFSGAHGLIVNVNGR